MQCLSDCIVPWDYSVEKTPYFVLQAGFVDTFRAANPNKTDAYTWWTHWANARARNVGWRIDYWLAGKALAGRVKNPQIHASVMGSDHCPVSIEI